MMKNRIIVWIIVNKIICFMWFFDFIIVWELLKSWLNYLKCEEKYCRLDFFC